MWRTLASARAAERRRSAGASEEPGGRYRARSASEPDQLHRLQPIEHSINPSTVETPSARDTIAEPILRADPVVARVPVELIPSRTAAKDIIPLATSRRTIDASHGPSRARKFKSTICERAYRRQSVSCDAATLSSPASTASPSLAAESICREVQRRRIGDGARRRRVVKVAGQTVPDSCHHLPGRRFFAVERRPQLTALSALQNAASPSTKTS
jgi:hypothetical protein